MFENEEFKVDKTADEYKAHKPTAKEGASDQEENDAEKPLNLNNLFAGQVDSDEEVEKTDFEKRISSKSKKIKKPKDKILTGLRRLAPAKKEKRAKKTEMTEDSMIAKLKSKRVAISRKQLV